MRYLALVAPIVLADITLSPPDFAWPDVAPYAYDCDSGGPARVGRTTCVRAYVRGKRAGTSAAVEVLCAMNGRAVVASSSSWADDILAVELSNYGQLSEGQYNLGCVVDPNRKISESDETNNGRTVSVSIGSLPPPPG